MSAVKCLTFKFRVPVIVCPEQEITLPLELLIDPPALPPDPPPIEGTPDGL